MPWSSTRAGLLSTSEKGAAGGLAELDADSLIPTSQLPPVATTENYTVADSSERLALTPEKGDFAIQTDTNETYFFTGGDPSLEENWQVVETPADSVQSVFGRTGDITANSGDYSHSQISNVGASDHHTRYADSEARTAVDGASISIAGAADTTQGNLDDHSVKSSSVHGISSTDNVAGISDIDSHESSTGGVHGIADTDTVASGNELSNHTSDTTNPHNVTNDQVGAYSTSEADSNFLEVSGDTLTGSLDMGGNTLVDGSTTIWDASNAQVPITSLEANSVTVSSGGSLSGGGTISLGGSLTLSVDDDFLSNTGDQVDGELVGSRSNTSRVFTANNTTTGDRFSLRINSNDEFEMAGYDSDGSGWDYASALSYDPVNSQWNFGSIPNAEGNAMATQIWVNNNADVPNADYADSAGDADTVDGEHASAFADSGHLHDERYYTQTQIDTTTQQVSDNGTVASGNLSWLGPIHLADTETIEVTHATFLDQSIAAAASGVDLIVATGSGSKATILSGDGSTLYDDETPATTYQNTSGGGQTVVIGIDNGHYNSGSGSEQNLNATATFKTY